MLLNLWNAGVLRSDDSDSAQEENIYSLKRYDMVR